MIDFARPGYFLALLLPLVIAWWRNRRQPTVEYSSVILLTLPRVRSPRQRLLWLVPLFYGCWWLLLVASLAGPRVPQQLPLQADEHPVFVFVVDVSGSMGTVDPGSFGKSRLENLIDVVRQLLTERLERDPRSRIAVVAFSKYPRVICPLTADGMYLEESIRGLKVDILENRTNIGDALTLCAERFGERLSHGGAIILCSDGAHNVAEAVNPGTAARILQAMKIRVYCAGIGTATKEQGGGPDEQTLRQIAGLTGGEYYRAADVAEFRATTVSLRERALSPPLEYRWGSRDATAEMLTAAFVFLFAATLLGNTWLYVRPNG